MRMDIPPPNHAGLCQHIRPDGSVCGAELDVHGRHARACQVRGWRVRKHDMVVRCLADWCQEQGHDVELEVVIPTASATTDDSRLDLILTVAHSSARILVDVTIADATSAEALAANAANREGAAAAVLERRKRTKYRQAHIVPFAIESHGRWGSAAARLARSLAPKDPQERSAAISALYQTVGAALQKVQADATMTAVAAPRRAV